jgi:hypothetical protein
LTCTIPHARNLMHETLSLLDLWLTGMQVARHATSMVFLCRAPSAADNTSLAQPALCLHRLRFSIEL